MAINQEQFNIKQALIDSAQSYFKLLNCDIIIKSTNFVQSNSYILKFFFRIYKNGDAAKLRLIPEDL